MYGLEWGVINNGGHMNIFNTTELLGWESNGTALGYTADGDQAMALCEVLNTSAFSTNTHVAFSSDQDNHCANWGASYTNRTGVLLPNGTPLTTASMIAAAWTASAAAITSDTAQAAHAGSGKAKLNGYGSTHTDTLYQSVTIPAAATSANVVLATLATYSNLNKGSTYVQKSFDLSAYKGQTVKIYFEGVEGSMVSTAFLVDDVSLIAQ